MNRRNVFAVALGAILGAFSRPAKAITTDSGARWLPVTLNTPTGPTTLLIWAKLPSDTQQQKQKTV